MLDLRGRGPDPARHVGGSNFHRNPCNETLFLHEPGSETPFSDDFPQQPRPQTFAASALRWPTGALEELSRQPFRFQAFRLRNFETPWPHPATVFVGQPVCEAPCGGTTVEHRQDYAHLYRRSLHDVGKSTVRSDYRSAAPGRPGFWLQRHRTSLGDIGPSLVELAPHWPFPRQSWLLADHIWPKEPHATSAQRRQTVDVFDRV